MASKFYVVWEGRTPGIYTDWASCLKQVEKFRGARYKSFPNKPEAEAAYKGSLGRVGQKSTTQRKSNGASVKTYNAKEVEALDAEIKIFTDGGCEPNPGEAGSGIAVYKAQVLDSLWYGLYNPKGTNNTAELHALHQALIMAKEAIERGQSVAIFCDSKYAIQCITQWAISWEKKGWKKASGEIKNLSLIQEMFALHQSIKDNVQVLHVNGHVGVEGNELADRMSIYAMKDKEPLFTRYDGALDIARLLALRAG